MRHANLEERIWQVWYLYTLLHWNVLKECLAVLEEMYGTCKAFCDTQPTSDHAPIWKMYNEMGDQIAIAVMSDLNRWATGEEIHADPCYVQGGLKALVEHYTRFGAARYREEANLAQARLLEERV